MVYDWSQKVVYVVVCSSFLLKQVSGACVHQPRWPISLEKKDANNKWKLKTEIIVIVDNDFLKILFIYLFYK